MNQHLNTFLSCEACGLLLTQGVHRDVRDCEEAFCLIRDTVQAALVHLALNDARFREDIDYGRLRRRKVIPALNK